MRYHKLLLIAFLSLSLACAQERAPEDYPDVVTADPNHYTVEFENDAVRLLRIEYGAGETSVMHRHPASCAVTLGDVSFEMTVPGGEVLEDVGSLGEVECVEAGVHLPENMGDAAEAVLIEFKDGAMAGSGSWEYPDAVTADPEHYSIEFENEIARILRIQYGPGESSVMHYHPAVCPLWIMGQPGTMELPTGQVQETTAAPTGQLSCGDATVHLPSNTGSGQSEIVLLELKRRETFEN